MKKSAIFLFATIAMLISGCSSVETGDISVDAQADPKTKFSGYKSYTWLGSAAIINDSYGQWEPKGFDADSEIKFLIDTQLRKRGMSESSSEPDLYIIFAAGVDMDALELKESPDGENAVLENVPRGGLLVVLIDSDSGFVIWAGVATADVQEGADAKTAKARLHYAVNQMFKKLPK